MSVHYAGRLLDGSPFDDSYKRGKPFSFPLGGGRVIKGWDEGIAYMNVGDSATLIIPSELGYGAADRPTIPANSTLIFDVQLMDVKKVGKPVPYKVEGLETIATGTGLKYIRMNVTDGVQAKKGSTVSVHYTGYLNFKSYDKKNDIKQCRHGVRRYIFRNIAIIWIFKNSQYLLQHLHYSI